MEEFEKHWSAHRGRENPWRAMVPFLLIGVLGGVLAIAAVRVALSLIGAL